VVAIAGGAYAIGSDTPAFDAFLRREATEELPRHAVEIEPFSIGRFPVTNAEWARFVAAGGYEDERWWDTPDARAWRRGDLTAEGARWNYREWRQRYRERPDLLETMRREGRIPPSTYEAWTLRLAMDDEAFEAHLAAHWPAGRRTAPEFWRDPVANHPTRPVVGVSWYEARAYAAWLAAQTGHPFRLPTEAEWEVAARGAEGRRYAFGDEYRPLACNGVDAHIRRATPVGIFPDGDTPEGVSDLTGNVWEWTSSGWGPKADAPAFAYPYRPDDGREDAAAPADVLRVTRGGSWLNGPDLLRAAYRYPFHPAHRHELYGFRLAC